MNEPCKTDPLPEIVEARSPVMSASIAEVINAKAIRLVKAWRVKFKKWKPQREKETGAWQK
jgi:hypothetical protein